jgi:hypothetical protein
MIAQSYYLERQLHGRQQFVCDFVIAPRICRRSNTAGCKRAQEVSRLHSTLMPVVGGTLMRRFIIYTCRKPEEKKKAHHHPRDDGPG